MFSRRRTCSTTYTTTPIFPPPMEVTHWTLGSTWLDLTRLHLTLSHSLSLSLPLPHRWSCTELSLYEKIGKWMTTLERTITGLDDDNGNCNGRQPQRQRQRQRRQRQRRQRQRRRRSVSTAGLVLFLPCFHSLCLASRSWDIDMGAKHNENRSYPLWCIICYWWSIFTLPCVVVLAKIRILNMHTRPLFHIDILRWCCMC